MVDGPARTWSGGCLCNAVSYEVRGPLRDVVNCHCRRCRRTHGHIGAYTEASYRDLRLLNDRGLRWYVADQRERGFCRECGGSLFWRRTGSDSISIAAGTLDEPTGLHTVAHIYVASRGEYYEITDALLKHAESGHSGAGDTEPP